MSNPTPGKPKQTKNVIIGKLGATHGIRGWLKVFSYTDDPAAIFDYQPWRLSNPANQQEVEINVQEWKANNHQLLVKLEGLDNPEDARQLTGKLIVLSREQLPSLKKNEFYWSDLIGLKVVNTNGEDLGEVIYLMETGSNDVLVVKREKEHGIPYLLGEVVLNVDLEKQVILVDWEPIL